MDLVTIQIHLDNEAFQDDLAGEVARILRALADEIEQNGKLPTVRNLRDVNGNTVGEFLSNRAE